jgi:integral membrane sensor domain MASE1
MTRQSMTTRPSTLAGPLLFLVVVMLYLALGELSRVLAHPASDAWTVWLASGAVFGLLVANPRLRWPVIIAGAFVGAVIFAFRNGSSAGIALGYGFIEALTSLSGAVVTAALAGNPACLDRPRDLAALALGAMTLSLIGAGIAGLWSGVAASASGWVTFRVWWVGTFVGAMIIASLIVSWAAFRPKRSGGLASGAFVGGLVACVLFAVFLMVPMAGLGVHTPQGHVDASLTYLPFICFSVVALLWGVRGATLVALAATIAAIILTNAGHGPFLDDNGLLGDPVLEVQAYALAISLTGLLVGTVAAGQRIAMLRARDWQTRFEAAIDAHRLLAYDWDPGSGRFSVTGDSRLLLGIAPAQLATLADWIARVDGDDRDRVETRFGERGAAGGAPDVLSYAMRAADGRTVVVNDEACPIHDHDGELMRIAGIVRVTAAV